jgi:hypothetical protein
VRLLQKNGTIEIMEKIVGEVCGDGGVLQQSGVAPARQIACELIDMRP